MQQGEQGEKELPINNAVSSPASQDAKSSSTSGSFLLCCSAQKAKSKWGTQALEERFRRKFPHLRILRIDSDSVGDPTHPAYGCIAHLNQILTQYDLVIASPSLETGVSIDIKGHFNSVWGIFQGVQPVNSVRQMLARLREAVDRHIWVSRYGMGTVGNSSTSIGGLLRSQHVATQANIALLSAADNEDYSFIDQDFQPESLQTWGKRACVINMEMRDYRESVVRGLVADGYTVIDAEDGEDSGEVFQEVKAASQELYASERRAIAASEDISDTELKKLQNQRAKTPAERYQQRKAELSRRYEVEVTPDLVEKDDDGWYPQLRLHYYLTLGREFLTKRDSKPAKAQAEAGENAIWKPDFNKGQLMSAVLLLEKLNLLQFLQTDKQMRGSDEAMQELKQKAVANRAVIKNYLNVTVSEKLTPVAIAQKLLGKIDLRLSYVGRLGPRGERESVYKFVAPDDERDVIFKRWFSRDELVSVTNNIDIKTPVVDTSPLSNLPITQDEGHNLGDVDGQDNAVDSWWRQVKSYATLAMEQVACGVDSFKQFLSTLSSDERWGVMMAIDERSPVIFEELTAAAPDWVAWMG
ncbi:MAG TPA: plasmid replication protein, CyRepA1 family [Leptolyngbyaceae cyanobacterium]